MNKYIITLIGFDYENKTDNLSVLEDATIKSIVYETESLIEDVKEILDNFISDIQPQAGKDKEVLVAEAFDKLQVPFASELYSMALNNEAVTVQIEKVGETDRNFKYQCPSCDKIFEVEMTEAEYSSFIDLYYSLGIEEGYKYIDEMPEYEAVLSEKYIDKKCPHCGTTYDIYPNIVINGVYAV